MSSTTQYPFANYTTNNS